MTIPYFVPDTSPLFSYAPCTNCATEGSWQSAYSSLGDGYDETFHLTRDLDSVVSFNITASSIEIKTGGLDCDAQYRLNEGDFVTGCRVSGLVGQQRVQVRPASGTESFQFFGIAGEVDLGSKGSYENHTIDDTAPVFSRSGGWSLVDRRGIVGQAANGTVANAYYPANDFFNTSVSVTTEANAAVSVAFKGSGIYLYGLTSPEGGSADVYLNGSLVNALNLTNLWTDRSSLLYLVSGLNPQDAHTVNVVNTLPGKQLVIDYALLTVPTEGRSTMARLSLIIGTISGASLLLLLIGVLGYCYIVRRGKPRRGNTGRAYGINIAGSYRDISSAKISSIDSWRKNAADLSSSSGTSFSGSVSGSGSTSSGSRFFAHVQPGAKVLPLPVRSPPPEYPDYLPYRGPVELRPPSPQPDQLSPLSSSQHSHTRLHRPDPIASRGRATPSEEHSNAYHTHPDLISPASTSSSLGLAETATRAMGGTRSVARLWPREAMPSIIATPTHAYSAPAGPFTNTTPEADDRAARTRSFDSAQYLPTYTYAGGYVNSPAKLTGPVITTAGLQSEGITPRTATTSSPTTPLRRGVSIKSVKTMRSFFSGLLLHGGNVPSTPALPTTAIEPPAARPDSDIFPVALTRNSSIATSHFVRTPSRNKSSSNARGGRAAPITPPPPPLLRLDTAESGNMFIELDVNSPITQYPESRRASEAPTSWRS